MYTDGIKIGDDTYLLSEEDGTIKIANGKCKQEQMEEYIKLENEYDEKLEEKSILQRELSNVNNANMLSKKTNILILALVICIEGLFILLGALSLELPRILTTLVGMPLAVIGVGNLIKVSAYGTKKTRNKRKTEINEKLTKTREELKELKTKIEEIKQKIEYSEIELKEDEIVPVTTVENKKANVKMRVLKLEQNR